MEKSNTRYIQNPYLDVIDIIDINQIKKKIQEVLENEIEENLKIYPPDSKKSIYSDGTGEKDYTMYTGTGGNIYTYWRYFIYSTIQGLNTENSLKNLSLSFNTNLSILLDEEEKIFSQIEKVPPSFFMGPVGIYSLSCVISQILQEEDLLKISIEKIKKLKNNCFKTQSEDELLYGNAGYLYSLLFVKNECQINDFDKDIEELLKELHKVGKAAEKKKGANMMIFPFPRESNSKKYSIYLGAAHGVIGIYYVMLKSFELIPELKISYPEILNDLKLSCTNLLKFQYDSGNFGSSYVKDKDYLTHFCHGATGAVYLYSLAFKVFNDQKYLKSVISAGNHIWKKGLLKKGFGLCHGNSGNGYALHHIYQLTGDENWKKKAFLFALGYTNDNIRNEVRKFVDNQRLVVGKPDTPYSLMEGNGGFICFLSDLLSDKVKFPGFEI